MDLFNNAVGRQVAKDNPNASIQELGVILLDKAKAGELRVLDADGNVVSSSIDDETYQRALDNIQSIDVSGESQDY